ncbi:DsbA family oxidoreductase, partial [Stenotrophomonas sp. 3diitr2024]
WEEENPAPKLQELSSEGGSDLSCTDGSCSVPSKEQ